MSKIKLVPKEEIAPFLKRALELSPEQEDAPFLALSLAMRIPLWSNDKALKKQSTVRVFSTEELSKLLEEFR
ncbi:MAG: PIN domain-containing protein [Cyanobacteriota bacterium]